MNLVEAIKHCKDDEKFAIYATAPFTKNSEARIGIASFENGGGGVRSTRKAKRPRT